MIDAEDAAFAVEQRFFAVEIFFEVNGVEVLAEGGGHNNAADIVDEAGDVIGFIVEAHGGTGEFAGEDGGGDAVLPEFAPLKGGAAGEFLEIFDDGRDDDELADLSHTEVKNGFLDAIYRGSQAVINRVYEAEETGGEARVATNDLGNLRGEAIVGAEEFAEGGFDAAEGREAGAILDPIDDSGVITRLNIGRGGEHVHRVIHRRRAEKLKEIVVASRCYKRIYAGAGRPGLTNRMDACCGKFNEN